MKVVVLGDVHSKWHRINNILQHEQPSITLCTGDLCNYNLADDQKMVFVPGNHESSSRIAELKQNPSNLIPLLAGDTFTIDDLVIAGLPGVYSPHFFEQEDKPVKYFSRQDIESVTGLKGIDILLCHDAPSCIGIIKDGSDIGSPHIRTLIERLQPRLAFFGHHHKYAEARIGNTRAIALAQPKNSYVILDTDTSNLRIIESTLENQRYTFPWENMEDKLKKAFGLLEINDYDSASKEFESMPEHYDAFYGLATAIFKKSAASYESDSANIDQVISLYTKSLSLKPDYADAYLMRAHALNSKAKLLIEAYKHYPSEELHKSTMAALDNAQSDFEFAAHFNPNFNRFASESVKSLAVLRRCIDAHSRTHSQRKTDC